MATSPLANTSVAVVGAGIVGLCTASHLVAAGASVRLFDPLGPGGGASFGNGGLISVDAIEPIAMPGMLRNVPKWLLNPLGPLHLPPQYLLTAAPWLMRWILSGCWQKVLHISDGLRSLHRNAFDEYMEILDLTSFNELFRKTGTVFIWESISAGKVEDYHFKLRQRHNIAYRSLSLDELRDIAPGISPSIRRAALVPGNGYVTSPVRLTASLAASLARQKAILLREKVYKVVPEASGGFTVVSNLDNYQVDKVVLAAGAWTNDLLNPYGIRFPLETERGYHLVLLNPSMQISTPIVHKQKGFGLKTMDGGIRITGTVEFGGRKMPMNERRARILGTHAKDLFPGLVHEGERVWMGFRPSMPDSLPVIGEIGSVPGLFVNFGHGHYGMIGAPASGRLLVDMMARRKPTIEPVYFSPKRFGHA